MLNTQIIEAGYCNQIAHIANNKKPFKKIRFYTSFGLIKIDDSDDYILFDTGYSRLFYDATKSFPNKFYSIITKVYCNKEDEAIYKLAKLGIKPFQIKYIVLSHFHADHIGGCKFFKNATFICSKEEYHFLKNKNKFQMVREGFISELLPSDFEKRVVFFEDINSKMYNFHGLRVKKMLGRKDLLLFNIGGHTKFQLGLYVLEKEEYLFVGDAVWSHNAYKFLHLPSKIAYLIINNKNLYKKNIRLLNKIYRKTKIRIICSHEKCRRKI